MMRLPCLDDEDWAQEVESKAKEREEFMRRIREIISINDSTVGELQNFAVKVAAILGNGK